MNGQEHAKGAAFAGFALHYYLTAVFIDDFRNNGQAETDALGLGGEERVEDAVELGGFDAYAAVDTAISTVSPEARVLTVTAPPAGVA